MLSRVVGEARSRWQRREIVRGENKRQARLKDMHVGPTLSLANDYNPLSIAGLLEMQSGSDSKSKARELGGYCWGGGGLTESMDMDMEMPQSVQSES